MPLVRCSELNPFPRHLDMSRARVRDRRGLAMFGSSPSTIPCRGPGADPHLTATPALGRHVRREHRRRHGGPEPRRGAYDVDLGDTGNQCALRAAIQHANVPLGLRIVQPHRRRSVRPGRATRRECIAVGWRRMSRSSPPAIDARSGPPGVAAGPAGQASGLTVAAIRDRRWCRACRRSTGIPSGMVGMAVDELAAGVAGRYGTGNHGGRVGNGRRPALDPRSAGVTAQPRARLGSGKRCRGDGVE